MDNPVSAPHTTALMLMNLRQPLSGRLLLGLIVALFAALPFIAGLPGSFVLDDVPNIVNNKMLELKQLDADALFTLATAPQLSGSLRVLPTLTFAVDYWRAGSFDPATFKATNILIHALTACALAWFFQLLLQAVSAPAKHVRWVAPALALAWALHPLQVSSVLYVVQRMQTMGTLFLVLALLAYLQARRAQLAGKSGRKGFLLAALFWVVALGCKEDSVLFPAYALALELTVLRFGAADAGLRRRLRSGYLLGVLAGTMLYVLWVVPNHWNWQAYTARDFSTPERLLTQARVLCMYLWQIVLPLPSNMPFYYDWLQPSRSLLHPWTTLPAILLLAALLVLAWRLRTRSPLFSLGVFLFFSAHLITSNVIGLELMFEHRNSFALIGAVLAIGSVLATAARHLRVKPVVQAVACTAIVVGLGGAAAVRAHTWADKMGFAHASTELAPHSARAWYGLCMNYLEAGGEVVASNPHLDEAIDACGKGAVAAPYALNNTAVLIVLKTVRGDVSQQDWNLFHQRLSDVSMGWENQRAPTIFAYYAQQGIPLDKQEMLKAFSELSERTPIKPFSSAALGYFIMNDLNEPDQAMPFFMVALNAANPADPFPQRLASELREKQRSDLALKVEQVWEARFAPAQ
ncbi:hypothetical protein [uncultured Stenotrophomonas sp.]|mgnify:CR=1 FL=1|uniref:hypothetical protein n=1 Tax=uncultured Stenotrophomonas sp. TaxID=165438 RepID=UPI0025D1B408|nr:hypothetical protein [uncultured Stenotrophomonas sp.]